MTKLKFIFQLLVFVILLGTNMVIAGSLVRADARLPHSHANDALTTNGDWLSFLPLISKAGTAAIASNSSAYIETIEDGTDVLHIVGEVQNNSSSVIHGVGVGATILGSPSMAVIGSIDGAPFLTQIPAGQTTCFNLYISLPTNYSGYSLALTSFATTNEPAPSFAFSEVSAGFDDDHDWYLLSGNVSNTSALVLTDIKVIGTLYNAAGNVVGCDYTFANESAGNPFAPADFHLYFVDQLYNHVAAYKLQAGGRRP